MFVNILCKKGGKPKIDTIYSVIAHIRIKSIKIKLDKEKTAMLWEKISEKLAERNWCFRAMLFRMVPKQLQRALHSQINPILERRVGF